MSLFLLNEYEGVVEGLAFSRTMFEEFIVQDKFIYRIEYDETLKIIPSFDELVPDERCLIKRRRQN